MADASERIVNLAFFLAAAHRPVSATEIAAHVYPPGQTPEAFGRMFERDKEDLRTAGLVIALDRTGEVERYSFDEHATYAEAVALTPLEAVELRTAAAAMLADDSFPFAEDLRPAMAKVVAATRRSSGASDVILPSASADESPGAQGATVARLTTAIADRKRVSFRYVDAKGGVKPREVEPWGLFAQDGRWYLVAFDTAAGAVRTFATPRISGMTVAPRPKTPDFDAPADFNVADYMTMPFQYGPRSVEALVEFTGAAARRAATLTAGRGAMGRGVGETVTWRVPVASEELFARWVVENGPGIRVLEPVGLADAVRAGLAKVVALHG